MNIVAKITVYKKGTDISDEMEISRAFLWKRLRLKYKNVDIEIDPDEMMDAIRRVREI